MSQTNKDLISRMFKAQLALDLKAYNEILHDDLVWEVMQFGEVGRPRGKAEMIEMLKLVHKNLGSGKWTKEAVTMTAEDDRVSCEAVASMELSNGNLYQQRYHYMYVIRDGKVAETREYVDTLAAANAFKGLQQVTDAPPK